MFSKIFNNLDDEFFYSRCFFIDLELFIISTTDKLKGIIINPSESSFFIKSKFIRNKKTELIKDVEAYLKNFGNGQVLDFNIFDFSEYTSKEIMVYKELHKTKIGSLISYKKLAEKSGLLNAYRFVGSTMKKNIFPILIPCHRVIKNNGDLGYYNGGELIKEKLINYEKGLSKKKRGNK